MTELWKIEAYFVVVLIEYDLVWCDDCELEFEKLFAGALSNRELSLLCLNTFIANGCA